MSCIYILFHRHSCSGMSATTGLWQQDTHSWLNAAKPKPMSMLQLNPNKKQ